MKQSFSNILIYGVGLMGASLAITLRKLDRKLNLYGVVRSNKSKETIQNMDIFTSVFTEKEYLEAPNWNNLDLIIFGTPVDSIESLIRKLPRELKAVITDIGSTKHTIDLSVKKILGNSHKYISSHPMCGSELAGPENAIDNLYENKLCILTPIEGCDEDSYRKIQEFWKFIGMECLTLDSSTHDETLAYLSHSPHILSSMMVIWAERMAGEVNTDSPMPIMGGGFRDMARIAGSNPEMWKAILSENRNSILNSLLEFQKDLTSTINLLKSGEQDDFQKFFEVASIKKKFLLKN
ncbi:MAG: prephenate dehydrogenase [Leptospira sp.]|nr:prephenate dehydrogenase [Leptospira sp.]NCS92518.1 prephenate dehydrogenase [Leptospira sp.]